MKNVKRLVSILLASCLALSYAPSVYAYDEEDLRPVVGLDAKVVNETESEDASKSMSADSVSVTYSEDDRTVDVYGTRAHAATSGEGSATSTIEVKGDVSAVAEGDYFPNRVWGIDSNTETGSSVEGIIGTGATSAKTTVGVNKGYWPETVGVYSWSGLVFDDNTSVSSVNVGGDVSAKTDIREPMRPE